jgi:membrane protein implicated in regulation of membrane protease activity
MRPVHALRAVRDWWQWPGMILTALLMAACILGTGIAAVIAGSWRSGAAIIIAALAVAVALQAARYVRVFAKDNTALARHNTTLTRKNANLKGRIAALETEKRRAS